MSAIVCGLGRRIVNSDTGLRLSGFERRRKSPLPNPGDHPGTFRDRSQMRGTNAAVASGSSKRSRN